MRFALFGLLANIHLGFSIILIFSDWILWIGFLSAVILKMVSFVCLDNFFVCHLPLEGFGILLRDIKFLFSFREFLCISRSGMTGGRPHRGVRCFAYIVYNTKILLSFFQA